MTTKTEEKKQSIWSKEEKEKIGSEYGCDIVVEDGSIEDVSTKQAPTDASIITYTVKEKTCYDLTRGARIKLFDMYWDKFKEGLQNITFGKGNIRPNIWGYQSPSPKKKRK